MTMNLTLVKGAIARLFRDEFYCNDNKERFMPVLQVHKLENDSVWLSDGIHFKAGLLRLNLVELCSIGKLKTGSVVRLTNFEVNVFKTTKLILIYDLNVICQCEVIGNPILLPENALSDCGQQRKVNLTGVIERMFRMGGFVSRPELQVIGAKLLVNSDTYLYLSDGIHFKPGLLQLDDFNLSSLHVGSIVRLTDYFVDKWIIFINDLEVVQDKCDLIGEHVTPLYSVGMPDLTQGAIARMCCDKFSCDEEFKRTLLQVIHVYTHQLLLSDGLNFNIATLPMNLEWNSKLQVGSVVELKSFTVCDIQNTRVIHIFDLDVLQDKCMLIGKPLPLPKNAPVLDVKLDKGVMYE